MSYSIQRTDDERANEQSALRAALMRDVLELPAAARERVIRLLIAWTSAPASHRAESTARVETLARTGSRGLCEMLQEIDRIIEHLERSHVEGTPK
jgi:hypothetical protein